MMLEEFLKKPNYNIGKLLVTKKDDLVYVMLRQKKIDFR